MNSHKSTGDVSRRANLRGLLLVFSILWLLCAAPGSADPINPDALVVRSSVRFEESIDFPQADLISPFAPFVQCTPPGGGTSTLPNATFPAADCTYYQIDPFSGFAAGTLLRLTLCARYGLSDGNDFGVLDDQDRFSVLLDRNAIVGDTRELVVSPSNSYRFAIEAWANGVSRTARFIGTSVDTDNIGQFPAIIAQRVTTTGVVTLSRGSPVDPRPVPVFPERGEVACPVQAGDLVLFVEDTLPAGSPSPPAPSDIFPSDRDYNDMIVVVHAEAGQPDVIPILSCTARNSASEYTAYFGYFNGNEATAILPVSVSAFNANYFSPDPKDRRQPTEFPSGSNLLALAVDFSDPGAGVAGPSWVLGRNHVATATTAFTQRCAPLCATLSPVDFGSCERSRLLDGGASSTLNNGGQFSEISWQTDCPGTLLRAETLTPTLVLDDAALGVSRRETCTATLTVTDDTTFSASVAVPPEIRSERCPITISYGPCSTDCAGVPNGTAELDECGVCGGDGSTCVDCEGVSGGSKVVDQCGVCGGDNGTCSDCRGVPNGGSTLDACGQCGGDGSRCSASCASGFIDQCGVCDGDNITCQDCAGFPNGAAKIDACGVCGGDGSSCHPGRCVDFVPRSGILSRSLRSKYRELVSRARRYIREAGQCLKERPSATTRKLRSVGGNLNFASRLLASEFGATESVCPANQCLETSTVAPKPFLRRLATTIYRRSAVAQRIVARCRAPRDGGNGPSSRDILLSIYNGISRLSPRRVVCSGG